MMLDINSQKALEVEYKRNVENLNKHKASPECTGADCEKCKELEGYVKASDPDMN